MFSKEQVNEHLAEIEQMLEGNSYNFLEYGRTFLINLLGSPHQQLSPTDANDYLGLQIYLLHRDQQIRSATRLAVILFLLKTNLANSLLADQIRNAWANGHELILPQSLASLWLSTVGFRAVNAAMTEANITSLRVQTIIFTGHSDREVDSFSNLITHSCIRQLTIESIQNNPHFWQAFCTCLSTSNIGLLTLQNGELSTWHWNILFRMLTDNFILRTINGVEQIPPLVEALLLRNRVLFHAHQQAAHLLANKSPNHTEKLPNNILQATTTINYALKLIENRNSAPAFKIKQLLSSDLDKLQEYIHLNQISLPTEAVIDDSNLENTNNLRLR